MGWWICDGDALWEMRGLLFDLIEQNPALLEQKEMGQRHWNNIICKITTL